MHDRIGALAAGLLAVLPAMVDSDPRIVAAGALAGLACFAGLVLPSLGMATAGAVVSLLMFAVALIATPSGAAVPEAVAMGAALLTILDLTDYRRRVRGAWVGPGVLAAQLGALATSLAIGIAVGGAAAALPGAAGLLPVAPDTMLRPVLAAAGGLHVYAAAAWALTCRG